MDVTPARSDDRPVRTLYVAICSDCDPDRESYGGASYGSRSDLRWEGVREGIARARAAAERVAADACAPLPLTWCVRADDQMRVVYGDAAWPYRAFAEVWEGLAADGHEIAWHPHVWRWDEGEGSWFQETGDESWISECLGEGYTALRGLVGESLRTSRMGWEFHNDHTLRTVARLGIENDCSAIPGWFAAGESSHGSRFHCCADWRSTPRWPYVPARADYRRPAAAGEPELGLCELPMSTFPSSFWAGARAVRKALRLRGLGGLTTALAPSTWRPAQIKAYVTIRPAVFNRLVAEQLRRTRQAPEGMRYLLTAFHPDELLVEDGRELYSAVHFEANLRTIVARAREEGIEPVFVTVAELARVCRTAAASRTD